MTIDLRGVFKPVTDVSGLQRPIKALVCDIMGTLIKKDGSLNRPLHDFLLWSKQNGTEVLLASQTPEHSLKALNAAGCDASLIGEKLHDKSLLQDALARDDKSYAVIDDTILIWLEADIAVHPESQRLEKFLANRSYETATPVL